MKSNIEDLKKRGYILEEMLEESISFSDKELEELLKSEHAYGRTCAIEILSKRHNINESYLFDLLIHQLMKEKALYTKIRICEELEKGDVNTARKLILYLGTIGKNQYTIMPEKGSKKKSYPLPRDRIARTISRMNPAVFPAFIEAFSYVDKKQLLELIDAIGFMVFYNPELDKKENFQYINNMIHKYINHELIIWKSITCLSAFTQKESDTLLSELKQHLIHPTLKSECERKSFLNSE